MKETNYITAEINIIPNQSDERKWLLKNSMYQKINDIWLTLECCSFRKNVKEEFEYYEIIIKNENIVRWLIKDNLVIKKNNGIIEIKEDCNKKMLNILLRSMPNNILEKVKPFIIIKQN